ncbi:MAG: alpha/beta fold hydrolase [Chloroflexi bacterium]|nr:alpha/beta fold hydrolase [Chloroflexota bacterium]
MKPLCCTLLLILGGLLILTDSPVQAAPQTHHASRITYQPPFTPAPCPFPVAEPERVECGFLTVPADHAHPDGPTMRLAVSILRSQREDAAAEPVLYLAGGPGQAAAFLASVPSAQLPLVTQGRWDFIFLDQRGSGLSQPNLLCPVDPIQPDWPALLTGGNDLTTIRNDLNAQMAGLCHESLLAQGVDPTLFTTAQNAQDVVALRQALGVEQWVLLGFSYGTYLAQEVMRLDPDGIQGVILDSPVPADVNMAAETPLLAAAALDHLFTACTDNLACRLAYPDLESRFFALVEQLNNTPLPVPIANLTIPLTGDQFAYLLPSLLGDPATYALAPALIADLEKGETGRLVQMAGAVLAPIQAQHGLLYSIICHDLFQPLSDEAMDATDLPDLFVRQGSRENVALAALCADWPRGKAIEPAPLPRDIPTLILVGELDTGTPLVWGERVAQQVDHSTLALVPGVGHSVLQGGDCPNSVMLSFLLAPTGTPNTECLSQLRPATFIIDEDVSRPWARGLIVLFIALMAGTTGRTGLNLLRAQPLAQTWRQFTWRMSWRAVGWWPMGLSGLILVLVLTNDAAAVANDSLGRAFTAEGIVAAIIPLMAGMQAAMFFSPDDEPGLEVQLSAPRPLAWLVWERLTWVLFVQGAIGLVGMFVARQVAGVDEALWVSLARWLVPLITLTGVGLFITLMSRQTAFGVAMTGVLWFALLAFGDGLIARWPFLWPIHLYLSPITLSLADYALNRGVVLLAGLGFFLLALRQLRDEERVLLGTHRRGRARAGSGVVREGGEGWFAAAVNPSFPQRFLAQLFIITRNEFRLQWRRRATLVIILSATVFPVLMALLMRGGGQEMLQPLVEAGVFSAREAQERLTQSIIAFSFAPMYTILLLLVPPVVAEIIPKDRQLGVTELFDSTPLANTAYLGGKLLGMWLSLLVGMLLNFLITWLAWRWLLGPVLLLPMLETWLFACGTVLLLNGGLAVFLSAGLRTRRWAVLIGIGVAMVALVNLGASLPHNLFFYLNPARPAFLDYYALRAFSQISTLNVTTEIKDVWLTIGGGLVELAVAGFLAWVWLRRKE